MKIVDKGGEISHKDRIGEHEHDNVNGKGSIKILSTQVGGASP